MAGGIQSFVPGIVFLSGYGKNHYEILRWGSGLLAYVLAASDICSDRLWGGSNLQRAESRAAQGLAVVCTLVLIAATGKTPYIGSDAPYQKAVNMQKLPADVCQICDQITGTLKEQEKAVAVMPDELIGYVRQYDASIELAYGRRSKLKKRRKRIHRQMNRENPNFQKLIRMLRRSGVNYLVYLADEDQNRQIESLAFERVGKAGDYIIYKDKKPT